MKPRLLFLLPAVIKSQSNPNTTLSQGLTYKCEPFEPSGHQNYIQKDGCPRDIYTESNPDQFTIEFIYNATILNRTATRAAVTIRGSSQQLLLPIFTANGQFGNVSSSGIQSCLVKVDCSTFNKTILGTEYETIGQVRIAVTEQFNDSMVVRTAVGVSFVIRQPQFVGNNTSTNPPSPAITIPPTDAGFGIQNQGSLVLMSVAFILLNIF